MAALETNAASITVTQATEQDQPVVARLIQLMHYDISPYFGEWISLDGCYAHGSLDAYWTEQDRHPYLIHRSKQLVGFALVSAHSPISGRAPCWFMDEFFVLRAQQRRGYGLQAVRKILSRHPGNWEIAVIEKNLDAISFWAKGLSRLRLKDLTKEPGTHAGFDWIIHSFTS